MRQAFLGLVWVVFGTLGTVATSAAVVAVLVLSTKLLLTYVAWLWGLW